MRHQRLWTHERIHCAERIQRSPKVVRHGGPPAASAGRPAVCHRQMTRKRLRGWRALRAPPEERDGCP